VNGRLTGRFFRIVVAAALTGYVFWRSDPAAVAAAARHADPTWILAAVLLVFVDRALMAWRWAMLLCIVDERSRPSLGRMLDVFFVSTFVGTFLPASIGGDVVRAYAISKTGSGVVLNGHDANSKRLPTPFSDAIASVFMDRMLGVASLLVMGAVGLVLARDLATDALVIASLAFTGAASAATMAIIFSERAGVAAARLASAMPFEIARRMGREIVESVRRYARFHWRLVNVLAASIGVQALRIVQAYCLGRSLGIDAGLTVYFAFVPIILLVMLLPVTINGLGTSQAAFVWFFGRVGVASAPAFALSILFVALGIVGNLPGGVLYAVKGLTPARGGAR
jgi:glycosyltransferase 2 family protein